MKVTISIILLGLLSTTGCKKTEDKPSESAAPKTAPTHKLPAINPADYMSGIPECDDLVKKLVACPTLDPDAFAALLGTATAAKAQKDAAPDMKKSTAEVCTDKAKQQASALKTAGCS